MTHRLPDGQQLSHYVIVAPLGAGGMGEVYLAEDRRLGRRVALKVLRGEVTGDGERLERFAREARAASALSHPNILTIYDVGEDAGTHFIVTEYIDGQTLRERMREAPLALADVLEVAVQVASALTAAHELGIVHRDVTPGNIMVRRDGLVKVVDFGLAKLVRRPGQEAAVDLDAVTQTLVDTVPGAAMGTVNYMSPEQARGGPLDARSDIFSLGAVLYEMLTGRAPFDAETVADVIGGLLFKEPAPLPDSVPGALRDLVNRALQKEPGDRPPDMATVAAALTTLRRVYDRTEGSGRRDAPGEGDAAPQPPSPAPEADLQSMPAAEPGPGAEVSSPAAGALTRHRRKLAAALVALLVALGAGYVFWPRKRTIAVMPFRVEQSDRDIEHLSAITTNFLARSLARVPNVSVRASSSVSYYKDKRVSPRQIGEDLDVQMLLTGHIVQAGDRLEVHASLIDARAEEPARPLWQLSYEKKLTDLPELQSQIARDVSTFLSPRLSEAERRRVAKNDTVSYEALELYSQGLRLWGKRNITDAIEMFTQAAARDSRYAQAHVGLANCYVLLEDYEGEPATVTLRKANENADTALRLDDSLAEAHAVKGFIFFNEWRWAEAEASYQRAIELNPDYPTTRLWYSVLLRTLAGARYDEAFGQLRVARELDRLSSVVMANTGVTYLSKGDANNAVHEFEELIKLYPEDYPPAYQWLGLAYLKQGRKDKAVQAVDQGVELLKKLGRPVPSTTLEFKGHIYAAVPEKREEALRIAKELEDRHHDRKAMALNIAAVYAGLGQNDAAIRWLRTAREERSGILPFMRMPMFDSLRGDPRYADLLRSINLTP